MKPRGIGLPTTLMCLVLLCCAGCTQQKPETPPKATSAENEAPQANADFDHSRVLKLRGVLRDHEEKHLTGVVGVLFAVYAQQEGGAPLWQEIQNVEVDNRGRFTALVGSTKKEGIFPELFPPEKALWLGKQVMLPGEEEQPRIQLVSTSKGLVAQRAMRLVIPEESGDQPAVVETQRASEQAADSPKDESVNRPSRSKLRLHRRRLTP